MCVNTIEAKKLCNLFNCPKVLGSLFEHKDYFEQCVRILDEAVKRVLSENEKESLRSIIGESLGWKLINLCLHYQDYSINIL